MLANQCKKGARVRHCNKLGTVQRKFRTKHPIFGLQNSWNVVVTFDDGSGEVVDLCGLEYVDEEVKTK